MALGRILFLLSKLPSLIRMLTEVFRILRTVTDEEARIYTGELKALSLRLKEVEGEQERREIAARAHDLARKLRDS